jgi:hypothetical protein
MAKKKTKSVSVKKAPKKIKIDFDLEFGNWWDKNCESKLKKIVKDWKKENPPNEEDDDCEGTDYWCINNAMWNGDFFDGIPESSFEAFKKGAMGKKWEMTQSETTYEPDLDNIIIEAYEAGKKISKK